MGARVLDWGLEAGQEAVEPHDILGYGVVQVVLVVVLELDLVADVDFDAV